MPWSQDVYSRALHFAARAHGEQKTAHGMLYVVHVASVAMEVIAAVGDDPECDANLAVTVALLHDVLDAATTIEQIENAFGASVAAGVSALAKSELLESGDAMNESLARLLLQGREVAMVKLAHRITNLAQPPPREWSETKIAAYREEARLIHDTLHAASPVLATRLARKIERYASGEGGGPEV
jgi:(p)ppGpp synthase/HD superfamily hydrolase